MTTKTAIILCLHRAHYTTQEQATCRGGIIKQEQHEGAVVIELTEQSDWKTIDGAFRRDRYRLVSEPMYHDNWEEGQ